MVFNTLSTLHAIGSQILPAFYLHGTSAPGQRLLSSWVAFIPEPLGRGITPIVLSGARYMYGQESDNSVITRTAIGAANIRAYLQGAR
jgi:hypothetical protein